MTRLGRALGPGKLTLVQRGATPAIWTLHWTDASGHRRQQALSSDKRVAERRAREVIHRRDLALEGIGVDGRDMALAELVSLYLNELKSRCTDAHWVNSKSMIERALKGIGAERVGELRPIDALKYRTQLIVDGAAPRTANLALDRLSAMLSWAVKLGLIPKNPLAQIERLRDTGGHARYQRRALSSDEITRLLAALDEDDRELARRARIGGHVRVPQRLLFQALLELGSRWNETRLLTWADLDVRDAVVTLRAVNTKSKKQRQIPLRPEFVAELVALQRVHAQARGRAVLASDRIFVTAEGSDWCKPTNNVARVLVRALERAGIPRVDGSGEKLDLHALRHSAATRWARAGVPIVHAQALLGHSDVRLTSKAYTHSALTDLRNAIERTGPAQRREESA